VPVGSDIAVLPSVVYHNIKVEADETGGNRVGDKAPVEVQRAVRAIVARMTFK
jgi:hypothetical protein